MEVTIFSLFLYKFFHNNAVSPYNANIVQTVRICYKIKIDSRDSESSFYGVLQRKHPHNSSTKFPYLSIVLLLEGKRAAFAWQY